MATIWTPSGGMSMIDPYTVKPKTSSTSTKYKPGEVAGASTSSGGGGGTSTSSNFQSTLNALTP